MNNANHDFNFGMDAIRNAKNRLGRITAASNTYNVRIATSDNNITTVTSDIQTPTGVNRDQVSEAIAKLTSDVMGQVEAATNRVNAMQAATMEQYSQPAISDVADVIDVDAVEVPTHKNSSS